MSYYETLKIWNNRSRTWDLKVNNLIPAYKPEKETLVEFENKKYTAEDLEKVPYFCYGSNLSKKQMASRCPDNQPLVKCVLFDYKLIFRVVADITRARGMNVQGALYRLSKADILALNRFEGFPYKYIIKMGRVKIKKHSVLCFWYEIKDKKRYRTQEPKIEYLSKILTGYQQWSLTDYCVLESIKRVQASVRQRQRIAEIKKVKMLKRLFTF